MDSNGLWRDADVHDEPFMRQVWAQTFGQQFAALPPELAQRLIVQQYDMQVSYYREHFEGMTVHVLRSGGFDVGRLMLWEDGDLVRILDIAVLPQHQGKGIGRSVLQHIQAEAGSRLVKLAVEKNRPGAQRLYESVGFGAVDDSDTHVFLEWRRASLRALPDGVG